ncbi:hypothetical protein DRB06_13470 [Actinomyces sp. Z5]|nr:hypothetical protein DRB06_13470 [Actinomyces sp. Z5]
MVVFGALFGADGSDLVVVFGTMRSCSGVREARSGVLRGRSEADDDVTGGGDVLGAVSRAWSEWDRGQGAVVGYAPSASATPV